MRVMVTVTALRGAPSPAGTGKLHQHLATEHAHMVLREAIWRKGQTAKEVKEPT